MDLIKLDTSRYNHEELLTREEKIKRLHESLLKDIPHPGEPFIPDDDFYAPLTDDKRLYQMANRIFTWLGIKHRSIKVLFSHLESADAAYIEKNGEREIVINVSRQANPYECAALLAHCIMHYLLIGRYHLVLNGPGQNEELTDIASIHAGLGAVILNGCSYRTGWRDSLWRPDTLRLGDIEPRTYAADLYDWAQGHEGTWEKLSPWLMPWVRNFVGKSASDLVAPPVARQLTRIRQSNLRLAGFGVFALLICSLFSYIVIQRPAKPSAAQLAQQEKINLLHKQYTACRQAVERKSNSSDTSDIFTLRAIEADQSRCESLRNEYNFTLDNYNKQFP